MSFDQPYEEDAVIGSVLFSFVGFLGLRAIYDKNLMTEGNQKLDKRVLIFNLPPVKSCPNHKSCESSCYAIQSYTQYPDVWEKYDQNFYLAKHQPQYLERRLVEQLQQKSKSRSGIVAVRVHSSGDFFSQEYVALWARVAERFPNIPFYAYTKSDKILDMKPLDSLKNFNLIRSFIDGKYRNYGTEAYVKKVHDLVPDSFICPAIHNPAIHCGRQCNYCVTGKKPLFFQHGSVKKAGSITEDRVYGIDYLEERKRKEIEGKAARLKKRKKKKPLVIKLGDGVREIEADPDRRDIP